MSNGKAALKKMLVEARRSQILEAAARVFARKGFHKATIHDVAREAEVADGTIYNYFASKDDLLIGLMTRLAELEHLDEELTQALQSDPRDFFAVVFRHHIGLIAQNQQMVQALLPQILINPELRQRFYQRFVRRISTLLEQYAQARIKMGHIQPVNVPLTVRAVQSMFVGLLMLRLLGDEAVLSGWDELPEVLTTLIFDGLRARPEQPGA